MEPLRDDDYELIIGDEVERDFEHVISGFPSPADDYIENRLDLNELFELNDPSTFLLRAKGETTTHSGIYPGDLLCVKRGLEPKDGCIVIAKLNGEFVMKRYRKFENEIKFESANEEAESFVPLADIDLQIWGVVIRIAREIKH